MEKVWEETLSYIEQRVDPHSFNLWFVPINFLQFKDDRLFVSVPDQQFVEWIDDNYPNLISSALEYQDRKDIIIEYVVNGDSQKGITTAQERSKKKKTEKRDQQR